MRHITGVVPGLREQRCRMSTVGNGQADIIRKDGYLILYFYNLGSAKDHYCTSLTIYEMDLEMEMDPEFSEVVAWTWFRLCSQYTTHKQTAYIRSRIEIRQIRFIPQILNVVCFNFPLFSGVATIRLLGA